MPCRLRRIVRLELVAQLQGGQDRTPSMVLMGNGCTEQGHKAVAQELIDGAFIAVHGIKGVGKELI
jgi:hypothetical protein